jgi:hypothetical protein
MRWSEIATAGFNRRLVLVSVGAVFVGTLWLFYYLGSAERAKPKTADLSVPPELLSLGNVWESEEFALTLPVSNTGVTPLEISDFSSSCFCLKVEPRSFRLEPGATRNVQLTIDLSTQLDNPDFAVNLAAILSPASQYESKRGPSWTIRGRIDRAIKIHGPDLYFGRISEFAQPFEPKEMSIEAIANLEGLVVESKPSGFAAGLRANQGSPRRFDLVVEQKANLPTGPFDSEVRLKPILKNGVSVPCRRVRLRGYVVPDLEISPSAIQVGGRQVGEAIEETVTVRSLTNRAFTSVTLETSGEGLTVEGRPGSMDFTVRQSIVTAGLQHTRARFTANGPDYATTYELLITYTGIDASVASAVSSSSMEKVK